MKNNQIMLLMLSLIVLASCTRTSNTTNQIEQTLLESNQENKISNVHEATLDIKDMTCVSCALGVEYELKQVDGIIDAKVNYENGKGVVRYDADKLSSQDVAKASKVYPATIEDDKVI